MQFTNRILNVRDLNPVLGGKCDQFTLSLLFSTGKDPFLPRFSDIVIIIALKKCIVNKKGVKTYYIIHIAENNA